MAKGHFTQSIYILLEKPVSLDLLESAIGQFKVDDRKEFDGDWTLCRSAFFVQHRSESDSWAVIDVVNQPWPDEMEDGEEESLISKAREAGSFGPFVFPYSLQRAGQQSWSWEGGQEVASRHQAYIRIRFTYSKEWGQHEPARSEDANPLLELEFLTQLATSFLELPEALCYFNPNGEMLRDGDSLRVALNHGWANKIPPLHVWSNIRVFGINDDWALMDSVGNGQLDTNDVEACFHTESYPLEEVGSFLRNVSLYLLNHSNSIDEGATMDGPGDVQWQLKKRALGYCEPPRTILRWFPLDDRELPEDLLNDLT